MGKNGIPIFIQPHFQSATLLDPYLVNNGNEDEGKIDMNYKAAESVHKLPMPMRPQGTAEDQRSHGLKPTGGKNNLSGKEVGQK